MTISIFIAGRERFREYVFLPDIPRIGLAIERYLPDLLSAGRVAIVAEGADRVARIVWRS